tara:strand:+ start:995 stop:1519 length:525 start_codon:yes stop_codon:yes gene_type:complete
MDIVTGHIAVIMSIAILISFVILAIVKRPKVKLFYKIASSVMAVGTVIVLYFALETMYGWPWKTTFPTGKYIYISHTVSADEDEIYIWLIDRNETSKYAFWQKWLINDRQPRNISVLYDEMLHEQLQKIQEMASGQPYPVELKSMKLGELKEGEINRSDETLNYILPDVTIEPK